MSKSIQKDTSIYKKTRVYKTELLHKIKFHKEEFHDCFLENVAEQVNQQKNYNLNEIEELCKNNNFLSYIQSALIAMGKPTEK